MKNEVFLALKQITLSEAKQLLVLAGPVFLAQIAMVSMGFVDMAMTGRVGAVDMAGVALATSIWMPLMLFLHGILLAITPLTAQARGAGKTDSCGNIIRQGFFLAICLGILLAFIVLGISFCVEFFGMQADLARVTGGYLRAVIWGAIPLQLFVSLRCFVEGMGQMRPAMLAGFIGLLANIPCNYVLIFGKCGFPALGGIGTGYATAFVYWIMFFALLWQSKRNPVAQPFLKKISQIKLDWIILRQIITIGFPGALAVLFEIVFFSSVALLLAPFGAVTVAGHQVAVNVSSFLFMVFLSLNIATTVRVGYAIGLKSKEKAQCTARTAFALALVFACVNSSLVFFFRDGIASIYDGGQEVLTLASTLLIYTAIYQWADGLQCIGVSILRGYNDTKAIFLATLIAYWVIALPVGIILGRTSLLGAPMGAAGFWISFIVGLAIAAALLVYRVKVLERKTFSN